MFARRACLSARSAIASTPAPQAASRPFTALAASQSKIRTPALADITPDSAAKFNERQKEYREGLAAAQKKKDDEESESIRQCEVLVSS